MFLRRHKGVEVSAGGPFDKILQDSKAGGGGDEKWLTIKDDMDMRSYLGLICCIYTNLQPGSELGSAIMHMVGFLRVHCRQPQTSWLASYQQSMCTETREATSLGQARIAVQAEERHV